MVAKGDETHQTAQKEMQGRWKNPIKGLGWYMNTKKAFAALAEDRNGHLNEHLELTLDVFYSIIVLLGIYSVITSSFPLSIVTYTWLIS
jgi:hypothetical protein